MVECSQSPIATTQSHTHLERKAQVQGCCFVGDDGERVYKLSEASKAHEDLQGRKTTGKLALEVP